MKAHLMYKDRDFDLKQDLSPSQRILIQDLELKTLWKAMACQDDFLLNVVTQATLQSLQNVEDIQYRQAVLKDCMDHPEVVHAIYQVTIDSIEGEKKEFFGFFYDHPESILHRSVRVMQLFSVMLKNLRAISDEHTDKFHSEGFKTFFQMIQQELDDTYFETMQKHLKEMEFKNGTLFSAALGEGNKIVDTVLRKPNPLEQHHWVERIFAKRASFTLTIHPRDDSGFRALAELVNKGLNLTANALAQSTDHILSFFKMLRAELGFYIGCLNLKQKLDLLNEPVTFPQPHPIGERLLSCTNMYDICLSLTKDKTIIGNDIDAKGKELIIITGANQGGKSTFLRSVGLSFLMMQCGMFVPALHFESNIYTAFFTHYKREEDNSMTSGKLDEELSRMSDIIDEIVPHAVLFFNESFAATNEREGSEIARQVVDALLEKHIQLFFVTHFYELSHGYYQQKQENTLFLRAQRQADGSRSFRLTEGEPLQTSFGEDLYHKIF